jgi:hypothetical protein
MCSSFDKLRTSEIVEWFDKLTMSGYPTTHR